MQVLIPKVGEKSFWGYMTVGFISLFGGIAVFMFLVVPDREPANGVPRDVQIFFTNVYMDQNNIKNETGRYTPALIQLNVEQEYCRRFNCLMTVAADGQDYEFRLSKDGRTWAIHSRSPKPTELGVAAPAGAAASPAKETKP